MALLITFNAVEIAVGVSVVVIWRRQRFAASIGSDQLRLRRRPVSVVRRCVQPVRRPQ